MIAEQPWVEKYRPRLLNDIVGQKHVIEPLKRFVKENNIPHLLFDGPAGVGKTTTALALIREVQGNMMKKGITYIELNASESRGINTIRTDVKDFVKKKTFGVRLRFVILDECDSMTSDAQQALRGIMEGANVVDTRFILICNYSNKIIPPIQSRCSLQKFKRLTEDQIRNRLMYICLNEGLILGDDVINTIIYISNGDVRRAVNYLQAVANLGDDVTPDIVYRIGGFVNPKIIHEMMMKAYNGHVKDAASIAEDLFYTHGLSASNILRQMHQELLNLEISEADKLEMLGILPEYEYRISIGSTEDLQMKALLVELSEIRKNDG